MSPLGILRRLGRVWAHPPDGVCFSLVEEADDESAQPDCGFYADAQSKIAASRVHSSGGLTLRAHVARLSGNGVRAARASMPPRFREIAAQPLRLAQGHESQGGRDMSVTGAWVLHYSWGSTAATRRSKMTLNGDGTFSGPGTGKWRLRDGSCS